MAFAMIYKELSPMSFSFFKQRLVARVGFESMAFAMVYKELSLTSWVQYLKLYLCFFLGLVLLKALEVGCESRIGIYGLCHGL